MTMDKKIARAVVRAWNLSWPPGTRVSVIRDQGATLETRTTGRAWALAGTQPAVGVQGIAGSYDLTRVLPHRDQPVDPYGNCDAVFRFSEDRDLGTTTVHITVESGQGELELRTDSAVELTADLMLPVLARIGEAERWRFNQQFKDLVRGHGALAAVLNGGPDNG